MIISKECCYLSGPQTATSAPSTRSGKGGGGHPHKRVVLCSLPTVECADKCHRVTLLQRALSTATVLSGCTCCKILQPAAGCCDCCCFTHTPGTRVYLSSQSASLMSTRMPGRLCVCVGARMCAPRTPPPGSSTAHVHSVTLGKQLWPLF